MNKTPLAFSLFSGLGGLDIGVERAGFKCIAAVEINEHACRSLRINRRLARGQETLASLMERREALAAKRQSGRPHWLDTRKICRTINAGGHCRDTIVYDRSIFNLSERHLERITKGREIDLLFGGPPCQSFSMSGQRTSVYDNRGSLFTEFARIASILKPKYILFENVKGILSSRGDIYMKQCEDCGHTEMMCLREKHSGSSPACSACSSIRIEVRLECKNKAGAAIRLILNEFHAIGYKSDLITLNAADYGAAQRRERVFIVFSRNDHTHLKISSCFRSASQLSLFLGQDNSINGRPASTNATARNSLRNLLRECGEHIEAIEKPSACLWLRNVVRPHDEPVTWSLDRPAPTIGAHQAAKLAIAPEGVPEEQIRLQQWHTRGCRLGKGNQLSVKYEFLSDKALLAIQTFPLDWAVSGTRMERVFQIGNAVPPVLGEAVSRAVMNAIYAERESKDVKENKIRDIEFIHLPAA
jgi:DNA (cytosine-5)-methyltransferase 1